MEIAHRQKFGHLGIYPLFLDSMLAFGTMPVAAGIVRNLYTATLCTNLGMLTKCSTAAVPNHMKSFSLIRRHRDRLRMKTNVIKNVLNLRHQNHIRQEDFVPKKYDRLKDEDKGR